MRAALLCCALLCAVAAGGGTAAAEDAPGSGVQRGQCDRAASRHARAVLQQYVLPAAKRARVGLADACPWRPERDAFAEHERHKQRLNERHWRSLYSNKAFYSEAAVDKHLERRHMDKIPTGADVCLADYCDVLQCSAYASAAAAAARDAPAPPQLERCSAGAMERAQHRCQMLLDTCFPRDASDARVHELNARLAASHCALLTCADAPRLFARVRAGAAAGRALKALGLTLLAVGLIVYYGVLLWTHGFWGLFTGAGLGSERRRRARGGAKPLAPLAFFGGGLGIRLQAARLLGAAVQRRVNKWRSDARRRRAQKLG